MRVWERETERERERGRKKERERERKKSKGTRALISSDRLKSALSTPNAALYDLLLKFLQKIEKCLLCNLDGFKCTSAKTILPYN